MASTCWAWPSWPVQGGAQLVALSRRSGRVPGERVTGFQGIGRLTSCCVMWWPNGGSAWLGLAWHGLIHRVQGVPLILALSGGLLGAWASSRTCWERGDAGVITSTCGVSMC